MNNKLRGVLVFMILTASCGSIPSVQPEPLALPYTLYDQEFEGSQVTVTLDSSCMLAVSQANPTSCCLKYDANFKREQTRFGVYLITVLLTNGYHPGETVNWISYIQDQTGSGSLWEGDTLVGYGGSGVVACDQEASGGDPMAVFVRLVAADPADPGLTLEEIYGPVGVLQFLPAGQGVVRLDP